MVQFRDLDYRPHTPTEGARSHLKDPPGRPRAYTAPDREACRTGRVLLCAKLGTPLERFRTAPFD